MADDEREYDTRGTERVTLFSDAVVAIAITLLAIDLPVPSGDSMSQLLTSIRHNDGHYAAFLISFVVIASAWRSHHDAFRYVQRVDARLRQINMLWLLAIILNPFATRLLTSHGHPSLGAHAIRFGFYSLLQALESGTLLAMLRRMTTQGLAPDAPPQSMVRLFWSSRGLVAGFVLAIPVFFVTTYGWICWFAGPILTHQIARRWFGGDGSGEAGGPAAG